MTQPTSVGYFGGQIYNLITEYKETKPNLFEEYKNVLEWKIPSESLTVPLMNWYSNHKYNIKKMNELNFVFTHVQSKPLLTNYLMLNIDRSARFIKYPKSRKTEDEKELDFLIPYILKYYGWSEREYDFYKKFINLKDPELHMELDKNFAFEKDELRKLGMKREKIETKFVATPKIKGFF